MLVVVVVGVGGGLYCYLYVLLYVVVEVVGVGLGEFDLQCVIVVGCYVDDFWQVEVGVVYCVVGKQVWVVFV